MISQEKTAEWISGYLSRQIEVLQSLPVGEIEAWIAHLRQIHAEGRQIFVCGNGGSATNGAHFVTDLGKCSSDAMGERFRVLSLSENVSWITAIGNDYDYADIFRRQLQNYANEGDVLIAASVSGSSPNVVNAFKWAKEKGMKTLALVGGKQGEVAGIADEVITIPDHHYGRVEDAQMTIYHLLCYVFVESDQQ